MFLNFQRRPVTNKTLNLKQFLSLQTYWFRVFVNNQFQASISLFSAISSLSLFGVYFKSISILFRFYFDASRFRPNGLPQKHFFKLPQTSLDFRPEPDEQKMNQTREFDTIASDLLGTRTLSCFVSCLIVSEPCLAAWICFSGDEHLAKIPAMIHFILIEWLY